MYGGARPAVLQEGGGRDPGYRSVVRQARVAAGPEKFGRVDLKHSQPPEAGDAVSQGPMTFSLDGRVATGAAAKPNTERFGSLDILDAKLLQIISDLLAEHVVAGRAHRLVARDFHTEVLDHATDEEEEAGEHPANLLPAGCDFGGEIVDVQRRDDAPELGPRSVDHVDHEQPHLRGGGAGPSGDAPSGNEGLREHEADS